MAVLQSIIDAANTVIWSYLILILASGLGIYFAIRTRFVQFRHLGEMIRLTFGGGRKKKEAVGQEKDPDAITPFQALCIACGGCIGTGNVAGVALAIVAGGPGAVFWMWLIALLAQEPASSKIPWHSSLSAGMKTAASGAAPPITWKRAWESAGWALSSRYA